MDPVRALDRLAHLPLVQLEGGLLEGGDHLPPPEEAQIASLRGGGRVVTVFLGQSGEVLPLHGPLADLPRDFHGAVPLGLGGLLGIGDQDVPGPDLGARGFPHEARPELLVGEGGVHLDHRVAELQDHLLLDLLPEQRREVEVGQERVLRRLDGQKRVVDPEVRHGPDHVLPGREVGLARQEPHRLLDGEIVIRGFGHELALGGRVPVAGGEARQQGGLKMSWMS